MDLGIWNENRSRNEILKNNSLSGHVDFFLNLDRKITSLGIWKRFGMDLAIPNIWLFGRLDEKMNYCRQPMGDYRNASIRLNAHICLGQI